MKIVHIKVVHSQTARKTGKYDEQWTLYWINDQSHVFSYTYATLLAVNSKIDEFKKENPHVQVEWQSAT